MLHVRDILTRDNLAILFDVDARIQFGPSSKVWLLEMQ
jgi:hypothetical protein